MLEVEHERRDQTDLSGFDLLQQFEYDLSLGPVSGHALVVERAIVDVVVQIKPHSSSLYHSPTNGKRVWGAVGENIIEASWPALVDGLEYGVNGAKKG